MSASLLHQASNIRGYRCVRSGYWRGHVIFIAADAARRCLARGPREAIMHADRAALPDPEGKG